MFLGKGGLKICSTTTGGCFWTNENIFSLNLDNNNSSIFFHKQRITDLVPPKLPSPKINNFELKQNIPLSLLGFIVDENLTWKY